MRVLSPTILQSVHDLIDKGGKTPSNRILDQLQEQFPRIPKDSLYSIYSQRIRNKYAAGKTKKRVEKNFNSIF